MTDESYSRRRFLSSIAAVGAAGALAGCVRQSDEPLTPTLPRDEMRANNWVKLDTIMRDGTITATVFGEEQDIEYTTEGVTFRNTEPNDRLMNKYPVLAGQLSDAPFVTYGAAKTRTTPSVGRAQSYTDGVRGRVLDNIETEIRGQLPDKQGLTFEQRTEEMVTVDTGEEALIRTYDIVIPYEGRTVTLNGGQITLNSGSLKFEAQVGLWFHNGVIATAGGVYPNGPQPLNVDTTSSVDVPDEIAFDKAMWQQRIRDLILTLD